MISYKFLAVIAAVVWLFTSLSCKKERLHWQSVQKIDAHSNDRFNRILFINDTLGFAVGGTRFAKATILRTTNGGKTWTLYDIPEAGKSIYGITQKYTGEMFAIGFEGKLLRSGDTGKHWEFTQLNNWEPFKDLAYIEPGTGIVIGGVSFRYGVMAYINDQNQTYRYDTFNYELNDITMVNNHIGYISGYGVVLKTSDGAATWQLTDIDNDNFTAIDVHGDQEVWTCGYNGSIYHTTDGARSWERLRNGNNIKITRYHLLDIVFKDQFNGWAVGENGVVIATTDGGHNWKQYEKFTSDALRTIVITPDGSLLTAGDNGALYKLTIL